MSGIEPSENGDGVAVELHDRVIGRLHDAGLTIAGILGLVAVDGYVVEQLRGVIHELDAAARDLRTADRAPTNGEHYERRESAHHLTIVDPASLPARGVRAAGRRYLCSVEDGKVFAYATPTGHDFFRSFDRTPWAHESGDLLLSARSGAPLARREGSVFRELASDAPLYYERTEERP
jgi:hypothetical protein